MDGICVFPVFVLFGLLWTWAGLAIALVVCIPLLGIAWRVK